MRHPGLVEVLNKVAGEYPEGVVAQQLQDVPRIAFHIGLALDAVRPKPPGELSICDVGGGVGMFSVGCAAYGFKRSVLIDDFSDPINRQFGNPLLNAHRRHGVEVVSRDVIATGVRDIDGRFDVVTSFDSMEHWHHSPKSLFHDLVDKLAPSGAFILGVPNCVNMRKRLTVPLGRAAWSRMQDWYDPVVFRGHVREPAVTDLLYIARDLGLAEPKILGRNWLGYASPTPIVRLATRFVDYPLRFIPSLCADIYLVGRKS